MEMELVSELSDFINLLTQLSTRETFTESCHCENFKIHIKQEDCLYQNFITVKTETRKSKKIHRGFQSYGMWCCIAGLSSSYCWRLRWHIPLKHQESLTQRCSVTSQKTRILYIHSCETFKTHTIHRDKTFTRLRFQISIESEFHTKIICELP
jgi:hypothetical protein